MNELSVINIPKKVKITGRSSSITNAFVNGIIPLIKPTSKEVEKCLKILGINIENLRCAYCGDTCTEWDHFRPIVAKQRPTGYITEIRNLVPACGKCNQSKGNRHWRDWILSDAKLSPKSRNVPGLQGRIRRLESFEKWGNVKKIDFRKIVGNKLWNEHWNNHRKLQIMINDCQKCSNIIQKIISNKIVNK